MNKILWLITAITVGLLGSTQAQTQRNGQYVLDDNGYHISIVDSNGNAKLVDVATKDVPWIIRFNPSSTLAGIVDKRTSLFRRAKRSAAGAGVGAAGLLTAYHARKHNQALQSRDDKWKEYIEKNKPSQLENAVTVGALPGVLASEILLMTEFLTGSMSLIFYPWVSQTSVGALAKIFSDAMIKRTQHLDRNLQLNVVEAGF